MQVNFLRAVDTLRDELQEFYRLLRRGSSKGELQEPAERLQILLRRFEPLVGNPDGRIALTMEQRWGYVQLYSLVQTARSELARLPHEHS